jgi:hypothetical protein
MFSIQNYNFYHDAQFTIWNSEKFSEVLESV